MRFNELVKLTVPLHHRLKLIQTTANNATNEVPIALFDKTEVHNIKTATFPNSKYQFIKLSDFRQKVFYLHILT